MPATSRSACQKLQLRQILVHRGSSSRHRRRWILFVRTKPGGISGGGTLFALDPFGGNLVGPIAGIGKTSNYYGSYSWPFQLDWHR